MFFLAFLDLIKLSISCFSWCHLKQCNSQERKYAWTFKYCITEYGEVLVSIWSQWPYFTGWLGNVCEKSQWSTIYLLHHLGFCIFLFFVFIFILPFSAIFQVMASQQPNLKFFLLRHLGFCTFLTFVYLNIFSHYCVIFQKMAWQRKSPMIYNLSLSANFSSPNQFCFLQIALFF